MSFIHHFLNPAPKRFLSKSFFYPWFAPVAGVLFGGVVVFVEAGPKVPLGLGCWVGIGLFELGKSKLKSFLTGGGWGFPPVKN
jgi:hypothetical protein